MPLSAISAADEELVEKLRAVYPMVIAREGDEAELAACSGLDLLTIERLLDQPGVAAQLDAARIKAEHEGKTAVPLAQKIALKLLRRIEAEADSVDAAGAAELMRPINRILENHDRVRLAEKDHYANLPVIHFTIGPGHATTMTVLRADAAPELVEDVTPKQPANAAPVPVAAGATHNALSVAFDAEPMPLDEGTP